MTDFLNSNFLQTLILCITVIVTLWIYFANRKQNIKTARNILSLQIKDIEANIRAIAKFASKLFLGQFTTQEAMGIDPIENTKLYTWHSRAMGIDIDEDVEDILGDEKK